VLEKTSFDDGRRLELLVVGSSPSSLQRTYRNGCAVDSNTTKLAHYAFRFF
jgi:hypothetical protein